MNHRAQKYFKQLLCRHVWRKVGFFETETPDHALRYSIRRYECQKCGKIRHEDGRNDRIEKRTQKYLQNLKGEKTA